MASVRRRGSRVTAALQAEEVRLLQVLTTDLRTLLAEADQDDGLEPDPLEQLTGLSSATDAATAPPSDPALARLLPDGYRDDPESAAELRRLTHPEIRNAKKRTAAHLLEMLPPDGGKVRLEVDDVMAWAAALNDLRLVLGTRLDISEDIEPFGGMSPDDPAAAPFAIYHWLTGLQDDLVSTLLH
ncbi:MAG TPA: DUF2017 domain-containing protein [Mycobacteriales bacterium]|jgi:hypothetical protein|nr:DUF2017 domain-containing protein [Mycobacteriales bacterium]